MSLRRTDLHPRIVLPVVAAALALAPAAGAQEALVPPGNSAVNQYTETYPTAGGDKDFEKGDKRSPDKVLGKRNARQLERQGPEGRAVAEVAAETAPEESAGSGGGDTAAGTVSGGGGGSGSGGGAAAGGDRKASTPGVDEPDGSSGLGEVLAQATGSSDSGEMGLWLPLLILVVLGGSLAFLLRRARGAEQ
jgi:hypothetical protein